MAHVDNTDDCCTLAFVKELPEEPVLSNEQDFEDYFLPLFLSACSDITATKHCLLSGVRRNSKLQCLGFFFKLFLSLNGNF